MVLFKKHFTALAVFLVTVTVVRSSEDLVLYQALTPNGSAKKLTCVSNDDGAALIWNYNPNVNVNDPRNEQNIFTNFEPRKPTPKNVNECAVWNSTQCLVKWGNMNGWGVVDSIQNPMGPVFDYRWEGFEEFVSKKFIEGQDYRYVGKVKESSGTVTFSVRGLRDIYVFLCENEAPMKRGPCFWIIIGGSRGKRSSIISCFKEPTKSRQIEEKEHCVDVATVWSGANDVVNAYEWRTFRLEWSKKKNGIELFRENEAVPFLKGRISRWHRMSHLFIRNEISSRIRFHFYDYFLARTKNAIISTKEFVHGEKNICFELFLGLCPECKLNFTLVDSQGNDIPITTISGVANPVHDKLMNWRSVRINTTLPNFHTGLVELKIATILLKDGVEGLWAMDNFRTCKSVVGLRKSTITIHQERLPSRVWPKVTCQKLSYTASSAVVPQSGSPRPGRNRKHIWKAAPQRNGLALEMRRGSEKRKNSVIYDRHVSLPDTTTNEIRNVAIMVPPSIRSEVTAYAKNRTSVSRTRGGPLLSRRARETIPDIANKRLKDAKLEIYEGDPENNTISLRLSPLDPGGSEIDEYGVSIVDGNTQVRRQVYKVSEGLACTLWENSVCLKDFLFPKNIALADVDRTKEYEIKVDGMKGGGTQHPWRELLQLTFYKQPSSAPPNLTIISQGHGIVTVKWGHPLMPNRKIKEFNIGVTFSETRLADDKIEMIPKKPGVYLVEQAQKKYTMDLELRMSTNYYISVKAGRNGTQIRHNIWVPSGVAFANGEKLQVEEDGTSIKLTPPKVVNATRDTIISVTVLDGRSECTRKLSPTQIFNVTDAWVAAEYKINDYEQESSIVIGGDITHNQSLFSYCALQPGETYNFKIEVKDVDPLGGVNSDTLTSDPITITFDPTKGPASGNKGNQSLTWIIILSVIIAICLLIITLFVLYRRRRRASMETLLPNTGSSLSKPPSDPEQSRPSSAMAKYRSSNRQSAPDVIPYSYVNSHSVKVEDFEEYVKEALSSGLLDSQFEKFPRGLHKPHECGTLQNNMAKNRYKDTMAYDHSRVVLNNFKGDESSDYINANYIQGYNRRKAYIAAQGPKATTVRDFWRMIWQEKVTVICMLANVKEGGKIRCEKYWPEVGTNAKYGDVIITNLAHHVFADYTYRDFRLDCKDEKRNVTHLHYTGWPDHGVPMYTQSLVSYLKKLQDTNTGEAPVVVHCSAGVGRTGTIILCDVCLAQANATGMIDIPTVMANMREDRANMVDSKQQYLLAHLTIVESMLPTLTQLPCKKDLEAKIKELRAQLPSDIQRLNDTVWQDQALHSFAVPKRQEDAAKDQIPEQVAGSQIDLDTQFSSTAETENNDIDAVSVDGVEMKKQYLAARLPSSSTLPQFWKLIAEKRIELVVILQRPDPDDPAFCDIIPTESVITPLPHIRVEAKVLPIQDEHFSVNKLSLTDSSRVDEVKQPPVTVLTCTGWPCRKDGCPEPDPPTATALVSLWMASEKISRKETPTLVLCSDGVTASGLYLALSFLLERMAVERECDVISAVRAVRRSNPEFVQNLAQFEFLYDAAVSYTKCFDTYSNFN